MTRSAANRRFKNGDRVTSAIQHTRFALQNSGARLVQPEMMVLRLSRDNHYGAISIAGFRVQIHGYGSGYSASGLIANSQREQS